MKQSLLTRCETDEETIALLGRTYTLVFEDGRICDEHGNRPNHDGWRDEIPTASDPWYGARIKHGWNDLDLTEIIGLINWCAGRLTSNIPHAVLSGTVQTLKRDVDTLTQLAREWGQLTTMRVQEARSAMGM